MTSPADVTGMDWLVTYSHDFTQDVADVDWLVTY